MKIALITDGITPYVMGGMQRHSYYVTKYLARRGVEVDLYHTNRSSYDISKLDFFSDEEKKFIRPFVIDFPHVIKMPGHYIRASYEYSQKIFELFKNNSDVDFIYVKGFSGWKLIEEKKKGWKCAPIGIKFHGMNMFQKPPSFRGWLEQMMFRPPVKFNIENSDYVFSYGGKITDIIRNIGVPNSKIIEIPTGIEKEWLVSTAPYPNQIRKFLYVGRYERVKGIEELSEALMSILNKYNFEFHFVGPIPDKLKIHNNAIKYHGTLSSVSEIRNIMDASDILVLPSHSEGMPNVILEGMARGMAIIASNVGAVSLMVNEKNGWLLPPINKTLIANVLKNAIMVENKALYEMKNNSLAYVAEKFLFDKIIDGVIAAISEKGFVQLN